MARMIVERMEAHDRGADVRHLDFPDCGHVIVRPWSWGQAPQMPFDNGGTAEALDSAHKVASPAVAEHLPRRDLTLEMHPSAGGGLGGGGGDW